MGDAGSHAQHDIEPAKGLDRGRDEVLDVILLGYVALDGNRLGGVLDLSLDDVDGAVGSFDVDVCDDDVGAFSSKDEGRLESDPAVRVRICAAATSRKFERVQVGRQGAGIRREEASAAWSRAGGRGEDVRCSSGDDGNLFIEAESGRHRYRVNGRESTCFSLSLLQVEPIQPTPTHGAGPRTPYQRAGLSTAV